MSDDDGRPPDSSTDDGARPESPVDGERSFRAREGRGDGASSGGDRPSGARGALRAFLDAERGPLMFLREALVSVAIVGLIGLLLFALSGVWPPMVAVESGSMEPHMHRGDLVFVSEPGRYVPDTGADDRGVVTRVEGERTGYRTFGNHGSVIVYDSPTRGGPPVIHRAHFWVAEGENWFDEANPSYHDADSCRDLRNCPAPHAGFITKGDANGAYDQVNGISAPVRTGWVNGIAHVRVPYLGYVRLWLAGGRGAPLVVSPGGDGGGADASVAPGAAPVAGTGVVERRQARRVVG